MSKSDGNGESKLHIKSQTSLAKGSDESDLNKAQSELVKTLEQSTLHKAGRTEHTAQSR